MSTPAAKSRIKNIMQLIVPNSLPEERNTRSPVLEDTPEENLTHDPFMLMEEYNDCNMEEIFSQNNMTSPSLLNYTAESTLISDHSSKQDDSTLVTRKCLVDYSDSNSENSYTLMDLDYKYSKISDENKFVYDEITSVNQTLSTFGCTQNETQPQPSTSSQSSPPEVNIPTTSYEFSYIDSEDSWVPSSSSGSEEGTPRQIEEETSVGKRGYRRKKPLPKRLLKKKNRQAAVGKSVQPNPCLNKRCGNSCADKFSEADRWIIFENYWGMGSDKRQKDFLLSCTKAKPIVRKRATSDIRKISYDYFIIFKGQTIKICQQFLLKTLNISQITLRYTIENANTILNTQKDKKKFLPYNKSSSEKLRHLKSFIEMLPAVPSHYCRNKSTKLYLPQEFQNVTTLYKLYIEHLKESNFHSSILSKRVFSSIFKTDFNIGFHLPKKDKCILCEKYKNLPPQIKIVFEETMEYKNHIQEKDKCKKLFLEDQKISKDPNSISLCVSFDLQKVLNTPHGKSVTLYYSRKYAFYNESIYESGTRAGYCYVWGECQGKRGCNEIVTVLFKYLTLIDSKATHNVINLYADSCAGQNRNRAMISMLVYLLKTTTTITTIKITYLLPGHTMMPVDSIHSTIEHFIRNKTVWAPSEWPTMITNSRSNPTGYFVNVLNYTDFMDWKSFSQALLPAKFKIGFNSLRMVYFQKGNPVITLQYGFFEDSNKQELNMDLIIRSRANKATIANGPAQLYHEELTISAAKYKDLIDLCTKNIIPNRYHKEYLNMKNDGTVADVLPETDADDSDKEN